MSYPTLAQARAGARRGTYFVRVGEGRWTRSYGAPPLDAIWVTGRIWRMPEAGE